MMVPQIALPMSIPPEFGSAAEPGAQGKAAPPFEILFAQAGPERPPVPMPLADTETHEIGSAAEDALVDPTILLALLSGTGPVPAPPILMRPVPLPSGPAAKDGDPLAAPLGQAAGKISRQGAAISPTTPEPIAPPQRAAQQTAPAADPVTLPTERPAERPAAKATDQMASPLAQPSAQTPIVQPVQGASEAAALLQAPIIVPPRLTAQIAAALPRMTSDGRTTELALNPAELGKVTLSWDGAAVGLPALRIVAAEPATTQLLTAMRDQIAAAIRADAGDGGVPGHDLRIDIATDQRGIGDRRTGPDAPPAPQPGALMPDQGGTGRGWYGARNAPTESAALPAVNRPVADEDDGTPAMVDVRLA